MAVTKKIILISVFLIFLESAAIAKVKLDVQNNVMIQSGHGGKQVADGSGDQQLTVYEPTLYLDAQVTKNTNIFGSFTLDLWTSASEASFDTVTGASGARASGGPGGGIDTFTKASGTGPTGTGTTGTAVSEDDDADEGGSLDKKIENRKSFTFGLSQKADSWTLTPSFGYSTEYDYQSINGGLQIDKSLAQDNFVLSVAGHIFSDKALPFDFVTAQSQGWQSKQTQSADISATQILSPSDLIVMGYTFGHQSGYLAGTRNSVSVAGTRVSELVPDTRMRHAAFAKYIHGFSDQVALHLDYRFYLDDWDIQAHTVEPALCLGFMDDAGLIKIYDRVYTQSAASFYQDSFNAEQTHMTSDSDLAKFWANESGLLLSFEREVGKHHTVLSASGTGAYYWRSNDLQAMIFQLGVGVSF